jgi:hypothetical protein
MGTGMAMSGHWVMRPTRMQLVALTIATSVTLSASAPQIGSDRQAGSDRQSISEQTTMPAPAERPVRGTPTSILINGELDGPMYPDATVAVHLSLTNPNTVPMSVQDLDVEVDRVVATGDGHCETLDFRVRQFSGHYGFVLDALRTATYSELGMTPEELPQLMMVNRPDADQNGCKGAFIHLRLTGSGVEAVS